MHRRTFRQLFITDLGHNQPTILLSNDNHATARQLVARYAKRMLIGDTNDPANFGGYSWAYTLTHVLEQCGDDLTRENLMYQASHMKDFHAPGLMPGIAMSTRSDRLPPHQAICPATL